MNKIIKRAVRQAQKIAKQRGLKVGDIVAHPDVRMTCSLIEIQGDRAVIGHTSTCYEVRLDELFDPNVAMSIAIQLQGERN